MATTPCHPCRLGGTWDMDGRTTSASSLTAVATGWGGKVEMDLDLSTLRWSSMDLSMEVMWSLYWSVNEAPDWRASKTFQRSSSFEGMAFNEQLTANTKPQQSTSLTTLEQKTFNPSIKREKWKKMNTLTLYSKKMNSNWLTNNIRAPNCRTTT